MTGCCDSCGNTDCTCRDVDLHTSLDPNAKPWVTVHFVGGPVDGSYPDIPHRRLPLRYEFPHGVGMAVDGETLEQKVRRISGHVVYERDFDSDTDDSATYRYRLVEDA